ncbi:MAG: NADP-dependent isocitrate dehydrogenase [Alphaproteobacteria bacterium]
MDALAPHSLPTAGDDLLRSGAVAPAAPVPVSVAWGDGIGPEIMRASLRVLVAAGAAIEIEPIEIGESAARAGSAGGIGPEAWSSIRRTRVLYKAPIATPQGGGMKSVNVTLRKSLGMFANVRPCVSLAPFVASRAPQMDVVIVRENEEDLYAGIEHRQTGDVVQCLKLISRPGCERIVRYAFEYARACGRRKVSCFTKDNIMKLTDGLFHTVFDEIAAEYPDIESEHLIVDIGAARLATRPERFDVVVAPNLYGDILSDIAAEVSGSVGLAPSANIGHGAAMFEAVHGSAPDIAGRDVANPSGLLLAGVMMLAHIGQGRAAEKVHNAWLRTIEDGIHTADVYREGTSARRVGTQEFAAAVIERLGQRPRSLAPAPAVSACKVPVKELTASDVASKTLRGVDVFLHWTGKSPDTLARSLAPHGPAGMRLDMISNRGVKVWPDGHAETACTDHWRCRYLFEPHIAGNGVVALQAAARLAQAGFDVVKLENLYDFDGRPGYSLGQGQ